MSHSAHDVRQVSVLLVEDDEEDKFLTVEALRDIDGTDYSVTWVTTAEAAVRELASGAYDVALLDYRLGAHTGIDVLQATDGVIPCILLTGQRDRETDMAAMRAGAADYIVKADLGSIDLERSIRYAIDRAEDLRSVRESELRFRAVVEAATDAILLVDADGRLITWNHAALSLFHLSEADAGDTTLPVLVGPPNGEIVEVEALSGLSGLLGRRSDGSTFPVAVSVSSWSGGSGRLWSAIVRDITWQMQMEAQLVHQAFHDPLTGLANRSLFADRVEHQLSRSEGKVGGVAVLFLDLDDFKRINDSFGHEMGDELLLAVASRLTSCLRPSDTAARLGGDEFAILVETDDDPVIAFSIAQSIMRAMSEPIEINARTMTMSCSLGVAFSSPVSTSYSDLLRDADLAMYAAKSSGKSCIRVFDSSMHARIVERLDLEVELRSAIQRSEIEPHYQPIYDLATGKVKGFEALARWNHPIRGLTFPNTFIPIAEASGAIVQIGEQILRTACEQTRAWQRNVPGAESLSISVNVSGRQFEESTIVDTIHDALLRSGLHPSSLIVEITESLLVDRSGEPHEHLRRLAELGVGIAIDDFGTGYSSLSYLQDLPITLLKVDRSFVNRSDTERGRSLVSAIVTMSSGLGLHTTAEGIETDEQLQFLRDLGCTYGQGYLFAKPMSPDTTEQFLLGARSLVRTAASG